MELRYLLGFFCHVMQVHMGRERLYEHGLPAGIGSCTLLCRKCFLNRDLSLNAAFTSYCVLIISHKRHEMALITGSKCHQIFFFLQPFPCCIKNSWVIADSSFQDLATSADGESGQEYQGMLMDRTGVSWMSWVQEKFALNLLMLCLSEAIRIHCLLLWWAMNLLENCCS